MNLPFEKNNYFWGKLLSVGDFQAEQRYFDQKRHLLNKLTQGGGVLCGLLVFSMDDKTIQVQTGAALDFAGREIVVHRPITQKLALIDGFDYGSRQGFSYLCAAYAETACDEALSMGDDEQRQYNRLREGCRLFLTDRPPAQPSQPQTLDEALEENGFVYLSKIYHVMGEKTYVIDRIEDIRIFAGHTAPPPALPPAPASPSPSWEATMERVLADYIRLTRMQPAVASGTLRIDIGLKGRKGMLFTSEPVSHGLGKGYVSVTAGIVRPVSENPVLNERSLTFGDASVFGQGVAVAAQANTGVGDFTIGVRLLEDITQPEIHVFWTAVRDNREQHTQAVREPYFEITPAVASVKCRESFPFALSGVGIDPSEAVWAMAKPESGDIDANGLYRAPSKPGIYELQASIGSRTSIAFVTVK